MINSSMCLPRLFLRGVVALFILFAFQAHADTSTEQEQADITQLPLEQLLDTEVITASKFAQKISDAPSAVTVITADDIKVYGYRTLADILNSVRGLYTTYDRAYQYLGGRGFGRHSQQDRRCIDAVGQHGQVGNAVPVEVGS